MSTALRGRSRKGNFVIFLCAWASAAGVALLLPARGEDKPTSRDPFTSPADPVPAGTQPGTPIAAEDLRITVDDHESVTFGSPGCPVVVAGKDVWSVRTGTIRAQLQGTLERRSVSALSNDGRYFASCMKSPNQEGTAVAVWSTETGKRLFEVPAALKRYVDLMVFSRDKYLILGGRSTPDLQVWDVEQNKQIKTIDLKSEKSERFERGKVAFSADGEYFVAVVKDKLTLFKTAGTQVVTVMTPPRSLSKDLTPPSTLPSDPKKVDPHATRLKPSVQPANAGNAFDAVFVYAWMQDMKFSPDGKEIAAISTHPIPRLIVWDLSGKLLFDEPLIVPSRAFWEHSLQWLPDKSGWLASGYIVDRNLKKPVFGINKRFAVDLHAWVIDADHLLVNSAGSGSQLQCVTVPWKQIRQSIALMKDPNACLLSPSKPVSIKSELGELAGGKDTTTSMIESLRRRLYQDGISTKEGSDVVFTLKLSEKAGDTLPIYERQSPFDFRGKDTGRTATERKGTLVVELTAKGQDVPLWRETLQGSSSRSFNEDINDTTIRKSLLDNLSHRLSELPMPYFIPKDEKALALPVVVE